jgi:hypothetical protein
MPSSTDDNLDERLARIETILADLATKPISKLLLQLLPPD